jgi:hypothetical protein
VLGVTEIKEIKLPPKYADFADIFSKNKDEHLPQESRVRHVIKVKEGKPVLYKLIYPLS